LPSNPGGGQCAGLTRRYSGVPFCPLALAAGAYRGVVAGCQAPLRAALARVAFRPLPGCHPYRYRCPGVVPCSPAARPTLAYVALGAGANAPCRGAVVVGGKPLLGHSPCRVLMFKTHGWNAFYAWLAPYIARHPRGGGGRVLYRQRSNRGPGGCPRQGRLPSAGASDASGRGQNWRFSRGWGCGRAKTRYCTSATLMAVTLGLPRVFGVLALGGR
jgi:hypothetical protein